MLDTNNITARKAALDLLSKLVTVRNGNIMRGGVMDYNVPLENIQDENVQLVEELRKFVEKNPEDED